MPSDPTDPATDSHAIAQHLLGWLNGGHKAALATVTGTWGSSPRPAGSILAVRDDGAFIGSVSGGCVEGAVIREALDIIEGAPAKLMDFGVTDEQAWQAGLACGGEMQVHVSAAPAPGTLQTLIEQRPAALVTQIDSGDHELVLPGQAPTALPTDVAEAAETGLQAGHSRLLETHMVTVFDRPVRLLIIGAVHAAQALAPMAQLSGLDVTVIDPRRAFATEERFPGITLVGDWPDDALKALAPDNRTAIVTLSHDAKIDEPALLQALESEAFYIGALGSRRTHEKRSARLLEAGVDEAVLRRIHAPIGLDLGGRKAAEIAVSVLAEILAERYGGSARRSDR